MKKKELEQWARNLSKIIESKRTELDFSQKDLAKIIETQAGYLKKLEDKNIPIIPTL